MQKSTGTTDADSLRTATAAVHNDCHGNAISFNRTQTSEISAAFQMHSPVAKCTNELDSEDTNCIPDTQFVQSAHHLTCLPANASSPDVEMIPDTPDNVSDIRVPKTFQRSYLTSRSNLLAACNGSQQKKTSPSQRKITKVKNRLRKNISMSTNAMQEYANVSLPADAVSVTDISPDILHCAFASRLPYPSCEGLNKRCATDPLPLSKRGDHKVTPIKPALLTSSDTVYGTVPSRLFQEALNREKHQQISAPTRNKENLKPSIAAQEISESSVLDSDPVLLEVLGELKVDSPKHESAQNVTVTQSSRATDRNVCDDVTSHWNNTAERQLETLCRDDIEDILGELRQQNGIHCPVSHSNLNDTEKNQSSLPVNDVQCIPSSLLTSRICSDPVNIVADDSLLTNDESITHSEARDLTFTGLKLEEQANDLTRNSTDRCLKSLCSDAVDIKTDDGSSESCVQSAFDDISDSKLLSEISFSATCAENARYISDYTLR